MSAHFRRRVFPTTLRVLGALGLLLAEAACGAGSDNADAGVHDASVHDSATEVGPKREAGPDGRSVDAADASMDAPPEDGPYPYFRPPVPRMIINSATGTVMPKPNVRPVYFAGETLPPGISDGLVAQYLASSAWTAATKEYGIGAATLLPAVMSTDTPAASLTDSDIQTWLSGQLDGTHPEFGPVDAVTLANDIFVLYYPAGTKITALGGTLLCGGMDGYHSSLPGSKPVAYVVIPRCPETASVAKYELLATAGDPFPYTGYFGFDRAHAVWELLGGGDSELPGPCSNYNGIEINDPVLLDGGTPAPRGWSNAAMAAYHDPCVPTPDSPDSTPYFASVPVMNDDVTGMFQGVTVVTKGIKVAWGDKKVVDVELLSDGPTGQWTVGAEVFPGSAPVGALKFGFDRTMGKNGDILHLTVTPHQSGPIPFVVTSTIGSKQTRWFGLVGQ